MLENTFAMHGSMNVKVTRKKAILMNVRLNRHEWNGVKIRTSLVAYLRQYALAEISHCLIASGSRELLPAVWLRTPFFWDMTPDISKERSAVLCKG